MRHGSAISCGRLEEENSVSIGIEAIIAMADPPSCGPESVRFDEPQRPPTFVQFVRPRRLPLRAGWSSVWWALGLPWWGLWAGRLTVLVCARLHR